MRLEDWPIPTRLKRWFRWCFPDDMPAEIRVRNLIVAMILLVPAVLAFVIGIVFLLPLWVSPPPFETRLTIFAIAMVVAIVLAVIAFAVNRSRW